MADKVQRKRSAHLNGEKHGGAKLTEMSVKQIRASTELQKVTARQFGVSISTVSFIRSRKRWGHI